MTNTDAMEQPPAAASTTGAPTKNEALRARIAELVELGRGENIDGFVEKFIPRDIDREDADYFRASLKEDASRWRMLKAELERIHAGQGVRLIGGDEIKRAEFRFSMPGEDGRDFQIDREVVFIDCAAPGESQSDWRADG
jgi:hypothetical protein